MYCSNCGKENLKGAVFCTACGSQLYNTVNAADPIQAFREPKKKNVPAIILGSLSVALVIILTLLLTGAFSGTDKVASASPQRSVEQPEVTADSGGDITKSTVIREPLPQGSVNETGYYTDKIGLLLDESELLPGLTYFYSKTGVQPYVYLTRSINGSTDTPSMEEMQAFAEAKYDELFTDGAHLLLVLFENDYSYRYWYTIGPQAASVVDQEAGYILGSYIDKYYNDTSLSYEQYFSKVFDLTADRIMNVTAETE